jgi:hypothetical protein
MAKWYNGLQAKIAGTPAYSRLGFLFPDRHEDIREVNAIRGQHFTAIDAIFRNLSSPVEEALIGAIDDYIHQDLKVSDKILCSGKAVEKRADELDRVGHTALPRLSEKKVREIRDYFDKAGCYAGPFDAEHENRELFLAEDLRRRHENTARYPTKTVVQSPHVVRIASDPVVISILTRHLGTMPIVLDYSCWWSFAHDDQDSQHAQLFHFDLADYRFCLMFIYLTDVDMSGGPHTLFEATHEMNAMAKIRAEFDGDENEWNQWYFKKLRKTDDDMSRYFNGREPVALTGEKGSTLLVNTRGIHKGMLPTKKDRLIIQVVYGVSPMVQTSFMDPVKIGSPEAQHIPASMAEPPYDYINWFFVTK